MNEILAAIVMCATAVYADEGCHIVEHPTFSQVIVCGARRDVGPMRWRDPETGRVWMVSFQRECVEA